MTSIDEELRAHFDDLRAVDSAHAPDFSTLWRDAEGRTGAPQQRPRARSVLYKYHGR